MLYSKCRCLLPAARAHKSVMEWPQRIGPEVSAGQQSAAPQQRALVKVPSAVYVSAGTVNHGPGIYNTSLPSHHKTLMFINVNAPDLYLNVIYMSQLKGVLMRGDAEGRRGGGETYGRTDRRRCQMRGMKNEFPATTFTPRVFLFFTLCSAICQESCSSRVAYLQSINHGCRSFSHRHNCHFPLCQFADDSLLCWLIIWGTEQHACVCVAHFRWHLSHTHTHTNIICLWRR